MLIDGEGRIINYYKKETKIRFFAFYFFLSNIIINIFKLWFPPNVVYFVRQINTEMCLCLF